MKKLLAITTILSGAFALSACQDDAQIASHNLSKAADNFEINRRVLFINGITGEVLLTMEGLCSIEDQKNQLEVTCKVGEGQYIKNFLGLSDNVTYLAEQMQTADVSVYHYRRTFKPQGIIPDIDFRGDMRALDEATTPDKAD